MVKANNFTIGTERFTADGFLNAFLESSIPNIPAMGVMLDARHVKVGVIRRRAIEVDIVGSDVKPGERVFVYRQVW